MDRSALVVPSWVINFVFAKQSMRLLWILKQKKAKHVARTIDILKKVAPDLPEGKTCEKEDLCRDIVKKLAKGEQKWAVALTSEQCKLLDDCEKSELSTTLGFSGNESSIDISDDDAESSDEDDRSSTNDNKLTVGKNSDSEADDNDATKQTKQCQEEESGNAFDSLL